MRVEIDKREAAERKLEAKVEWPLHGDPISQASLWLPLMMYRWQTEVIRACMTAGARVACVTPNESGKTSMVLPALGLAWMAAFPGSQVVSTSGVERQIKKQLWPVLRSILAPYPRWQITEDLHIKAPSVRGIPGSEWEAFTTKDPAYAEGFHPRWYLDENRKPVYAPLLIIIDEAKTFNDPELMFAFQKRCDPDVLLMVSTPGEDVGAFYDAFHKDKKAWKTFEVGWRDCPHLCRGVKLEKRLETIRELGENHPLVQSWVYGKFYRSGSRLLFDNMVDVEMAMSGTLPAVKGAGRGVALDFSGGGDEQVLAWRDGNRVMPLEIFHEKDAVKLADMWVRRFKELRVEATDIVADNGGLGKVCIDLLESKGFQGIQRYMAADEARAPEMYKFRVTEDHYELRERLMMQSVILPDDDKLKEQMRKRRYLVKNEENQIQIEPKEKMRDRGEGSPDRLDAVVMLLTRMEMKGMAGQHGATGTETRKDARCGNWQECMPGWQGGTTQEAGGEYWSGGGVCDD
jgi:hypothetical protein